MTTEVARCSVSGHPVKDVPRPMAKVAKLTRRGASAGGCTRPPQAAQEPAIEGQVSPASQIWMAKVEKVGGVSMAHFTDGIEVVRSQAQTAAA